MCAYTFWDKIAHELYSFTCACLSAHAHKSFPREEDPGADAEKKKKESGICLEQEMIGPQGK